MYRYFVSQSRQFCCHNPLSCFSTYVYCCCCCLFRYDLVRKRLDKSLYVALVSQQQQILLIFISYVEHIGGVAVGEGEGIKC
jgi:hypothetical protein